MKIKVAKVSLIAWLIAGLVAVALPANVGAEDFYAGKNIRFIVGYAPGGGYDTYTRAIARHMSRFIPGNPSVVVENMDGAGSLLAANYLFNKAEPDGLTVGNFNSGMVTQQALASRGVRFDARKFGWIGSPVKGFPVCMIMGFTGLKSLDEIVKNSAKIKFGGTRAGASSDDMPKPMNALMGTKFNLIPGYKGTGPIRVALQRKEIEGLCSGWESMRVTARALLDAEGDNKLIPFIIHGKMEDKETQGLPQYLDVIKGDENKRAFKAWVNQFEFQRPLVLPPNVPSERLQTLRGAMQKTLIDSTFLAEAKKSKMLIDNVTGQDIEKYVDEMLSISPNIKKTLSVLLPGTKS